MPMATLSIDLTASTKGFDAGTREAERNLRRLSDTAGATFGRMEASAKQTQAALRGIPAQFTDIVVSISSGQSPMTVLLQQGGQLKDMFGGIGGAARAMGGYVASLITPMNLVLGAAGAMAYALYSSSSALGDMQKQLTLTGNRVGLTASQFQDLAGTVAAGANTTLGNAAKALTEVAKAGDIGGESIKKVAIAALQLEQDGGPAVAKTVEAFASLGREPLQAAIKMNEQVSFMTPALYESARALENQGRSADAARLIASAYAVAVSDATKKIQADMGTLERGWLAVKQAAADALGTVSAVIGLGVSEIDKATAKAIAAQKALDFARKGPQRDNVGLIKQLEDEQKATQATLDGLRMAENAERRFATAREDNEKRLKALVTARSISDPLDKRLMAEKEIARYTNAAREAGIGELEIQKNVAALREKYADKSKAGGTGMAPGDSELARIRSATQEAVRYTEALRSQGLEATKLTDGERRAAQIQEELKGSMNAQTRAAKERLLVAAQQQGVAERARDAELQRQKAMQQARDDYDKLVVSTFSAAESIEDQARKQDAANAVFGKGKAAVEEYTLAVMERRAAEIEAGNAVTGGADALVQALNTQLRAQRQYVDALKAGEGKQVNFRMDEWRQASKEQLSNMQDVRKLSLLQGVDREQEIARMEVQNKLADQLRAIERTDTDQASKDSAAEKARSAARLEEAVRVNKIINDDWLRTADSIGQGLADALMEGFSSGAKAGEMLRNQLKAMFAQLVLRPLIQPVANWLTDGIKNFNWASLFNGQVMANANGNVFGSPQMFAFASGAGFSLGVLGEAGPEAVMPLKRGADGRLGVAASGGGGRTVIQQTINVSAGVSRNEMMAAVAMGVREADRRRADDLMRGR